MDVESNLAQIALIFLRPCAFECHLACARAVAAGKSAEPGDVTEALQILTKAAAQVVKRLSNRRNTDEDLETLRKAVAQAEQTLAALECPLPPSRLKA